MKTLKKNIVVIVVLLLSGAATGFAVWPPSTSAGKDTGSYFDGGSDKSAFRQSHTPGERLENDTRRLEDVLKDVKEDAQELRRSYGTSGSGPQMPGPKK